MSAAIQITYIEKTLDEVLTYFVGGFRPADGRMVANSEFCVDPVRNKVIVKLWMQDAPPTVSIHE